MICLGCGVNCKCKEPASFRYWPVEASLTPEAAEAAAEAIDFYLAALDSSFHSEEARGELKNISNHIRSALGREPERMPECPTPQKRKYSNAAHTTRDAQKFHMYAYDCACGYWHLSKQHPNEHAAKINAPGASADEFPTINPMLL